MPSEDKPASHPLRKEAPTSLARAAFKFGSGTMVSRVLGFLRDALITNIFSRELTDAFYAAWRLPNLFRRLLGEGALAVSFVPLFVELKRDDATSQELRELINGVYTLLLIIVTTVTALGIIFMEPLMELLVSGDGFSAIPGKLEQTVYMARLCFSFLFFVSLFALFMAILNGLNLFGWTGVAPAFSNLALIVAALTRESYVGSEATALGVAVIAGGALQLGALVPPLIKSGHFPRLIRNPFNRYTKKILATLGPSLIGLGSLQITALINIHFASYLPSGTMTYIYMADRILEMPLSLVAVSLQTTMLPLLSNYWASGQRSAMIEASRKAVRLNYFLAIPASVGMFVLAEPIVKTLFQWKGYGATEIDVTAQILRVYAFTLITAGGVRLTSQNFYAMKDTWTPAKVSLFATLLHLPTAWYLTKIYGLNGLNIATLWTSFVNLSVLGYFVQKKIGPLGLKQLFKDLVPFCASALTMGAAVYFLFDETIRLFGHSKLAQLSGLTLVVTAGGAIYFLMNMMFRVPEVSWVMAKFSKKKR